MKPKRLNADQLARLADLTGLPEPVLREINTTRLLRTEDDKMRDMAEEIGEEDFQAEMDEDELENQPILDACESRNLCDRLNEDKRTLLFTTWNTAQALRFILNNKRLREDYLTNLESEYATPRNNLFRTAGWQHLAAELRKDLEQRLFTVSVET